MSSRNDYRWISEDLVTAVHEAQIAEHGGANGVRDQGLLASALARPRNAALHAKPDVPELAALYALGIIKNHPFVDGNKRVGAVLLEVFLEDHGLSLTATDEELFAAIQSVAAGETSEAEFIAWVRTNTNVT